MIGTETLASRGGGAARYGARWLLLATAVDSAMLVSSYCVNGATIELALSVCTMLGAKTTFHNSSIAPIHLAHFLGVHVFGTPSLRLSGRGAPFPRAEPAGTMFEAEATSTSTYITTFSRADPRAPCFTQSPFLAALLLQPSVEHFTLAE